MSDIEVPVLIVGGSLVGMTASLLLGHHGVRSLVVEHHRGTAIHPRAASVTQRTMEIFRSVGLEQLVRARSEEQFVQDAGVVGVESLAGGATANYIANFNEGIRDVSPTVRVFLSQNSLEPLLKERAEQLGAHIEFATECISFEHDDDGVTSVIRDRDTGATRTVRARYMIAADGARSMIRDALGVSMIGHGSFSNSVTIYFRANLRRYLEGKLWAVVYVNHPQLRGFFRFEKPFDSGFLVVNTLGDPANPDVDVSRDLGPDRALALVRTAIGEDIPVIVENIMHWQATASTAERFGCGRIFLAGDAAHVMPPTGGWGGNAGVQDAHNLAWKVAFVLNGLAAPPLLSTYDGERRPAGVLTVEQAYTRYVLRTDPSIPQSTMQPMVGDLDIELGYTYRSPAIVEEEGRGLPLHLNPRESHGAPGTRAPHYWIEYHGEPISTLDLIGRDFTLLAGSNGDAWCESMRTAAARIGMQLSEFQLGRRGLVDPRGRVAEGMGLTPSGCLLIRPDGFVAWRERDGVGASSDRAAQVLRRLLCHA